MRCETEEGRKIWALREAVQGCVKVVTKDEKHEEEALNKKYLEDVRFDKYRWMQMQH